MAASSAELGMCWVIPSVPNARCNLKNVGALDRTFLCRSLADCRPEFSVEVLVNQSKTENSCVCIIFS